MPVNLRELPSIDQFFHGNPALVAQFGRPLTHAALESVLKSIRRGEVDLAGMPLMDEIIRRTYSKLQEWTRLPLVPVINATGVVLHTNLGRAPLSAATIAAMGLAGGGYSTLEFDLFDGKRGKRDALLEPLLQRLTGAEAALVVNNCASAVLLALSALAKGKSVLIPRSQLVEIGGGFRVPDVMKQSGAKLVEVGTTNKVHLSDVEEPYVSTNNPAQLLTFIAHRSNFQIIGFTQEPPLKEICETVHSFGGNVIYDLGSGALLDTAKYGMQHEITVQEGLKAGADLVMFSGDKLLGGPQAGIIVGRKELLDKLKKHPLARAVRADKTTLAGLAATISHYLKDEAEKEIPIWRYISRDKQELKQRCTALCAAVGCGDVIKANSTVGGGSLPGETLPSWVWAVKGKRLQEKLGMLRKVERPIIGRIEQEQLVIDLRCVEEVDDGIIADACKKIFG